MSFGHEQPGMVTGTVLCGQGNGSGNATHPTEDRSRSSGAPAILWSARAQPRVLGRSRDLGYRRVHHRRSAT